MGRIRTIKPEFCQSETLGSISRDARLCFVLLWTCVDDEGRCSAAIRVLAGALFPFDEDAAKLIEDWLNELEKIKCILRYQVDGKSCLQVLNWKKHQKIDRPSTSRRPPPPGFDGASMKPIEASTHPRLPLDAGPRTMDLGSRTVDLRPSTPDHAAHADADARMQLFSALFFEVYPKHQAEDGVARELARLVDAGIDFDDIIAGAKRYRAEVAGKSPQMIANPLSWLRNGRWKDGRRKVTEKPVEMGIRVDRDTPEGRAWLEHECAGGRSIKWILSDGRHGPGRYFSSRFPPGYVAAE